MRMEQREFCLKHKELELKISTYIRKNKDERLVCLHGLQSNKDMFQELVSKPCFNNYSLLLIDFVGFGSSSKPENFSYDLMEQAIICKEIFVSLGLKNIHLIGHSMGGMVGTLLLEMTPEKIISLINMEGNFVLEDCGTSKDVEHLTFQEFHEKEYEKIKKKIKNSNESSTKHRLGWLKLIPNYAFYKSSLSIVNWSRNRKLLHIFLDSKHKKLYVYGDKNGFKVNSLQGEIQLAEIANAGHFMLIDNFTNCAEQIE